MIRTAEELESAIAVTPDKYGAELPGIPLMSVEDLREAAKGIDIPVAPGCADAYETLDDWLQDNGLQLLQNALQICQKRIASE